MPKDTQSGKRKRPRTRKAKSTLAMPAPAPPPPPTRSQQAVELGRSIFRKGAHDAAADVVKRVILGAVGFIVLAGGGYYFGFDFGRWFRPHQPVAPMETGSIPKAAKPVAPDPEAKRREIECNIAKAREIDAAIERRKTSFSAYTKCLVDWKPAANEKQTPEQACTPKLAEHQKIGQEVRDKQAKDCAAPAVPK